MTKRERLARTLSRQPMQADNNNTSQMEDHSSRDSCPPIVSDSEYTDTSDPRVRNHHLRPCEAETSVSAMTKTTDLSPDLASLPVFPSEGSSSVADHVSVPSSTTGLRTIVPAIGDTATSLTWDWSTITSSPETHALSADLVSTSTMTTVVPGASSLSSSLLSLDLPSPPPLPVFPNTESISTLPQPVSSKNNWSWASLATVTPSAITATSSGACSDADDINCVTLTSTTNMGTMVTTVTSLEAQTATETEIGVITSTMVSLGMNMPSLATATEAVPSISSVIIMPPLPPASSTQVPTAWPPTFTATSTGGANPMTFSTAMSPTGPMAMISTTSKPTPAPHAPSTLSTATKIAVPIVIAILLIILALFVLLHKRKKRNYKEDNLAQKAEWLEPGYVEKIRAQMGVVDEGKVGVIRDSPAGDGTRVEGGSGVKEEEDKRDSGYSSNSGKEDGMGGWRVYRGTEEIKAGQERSDVAESKGVNRWWRRSVFL